MDYSSHRRPRSARLAPYRHALDHFEAFLNATGDEDEQAKMKRAFVLLFGEPPDGWEEGTLQFEPGDYLDAQPPEAPGKAR